MKRISIYVILITTILTYSCREILFDDEISTREIYLDDFSALSVNGIYDLVLVQDSANMIEITGSNKISLIDAVIENDTLIIDDHKKFSLNTFRNQLIIHFSTLDFISTNDPVNISNRDTITADRFVYHGIGEITEASFIINCNYLYVATSANTLGNFYFSGRASYCLLWNRYGSGMFADSLICSDADIYTESVGPVNINASEHIRAFIRGPGNIYYYGNPVIDIEEKTGEGKIIKIY